jgi:hypothetical protein
MQAGQAISFFLQCQFLKKCIQQADDDDQAEELHWLALSNPFLP